jgi:predicted nuclease with RNAse H fold
MPVDVENLLTSFIGIDFSGGARPWRAVVGRPTVWLATVTGSEKPRLEKLMAVQSLEGEGTPFDKLARLLAAGDFEAAAIDAPFSLPSIHLPRGGHGELLRLVRELPNAPDRPFPSGNSIVVLGETVASKARAKPLRETEAYWADRGVNVRSTMWDGARGGAPLTAACLRLLERAGRPCWPWAALQKGILVEAFPAAQLRHWGLPHQRYSGTDDAGVRETILEGIRKRIQMSSSHEDIMVKSADAVDATIAAFAAIAVATNKIAGFEPGHPDGFISVAE